MTRKERPLPEHTEVLVVGAGFGGLAAAIRLQDKGFDDLVVIERGHTVGGTWRDNDYPGAACDVPSQLYSLSFALNPDWSHSFSRQPEIQAYLERVADEYGVRSRLHTSTELLDASWDDTAASWRVRTSRGDITARFLVICSGGLSEPSIPAIPGLEHFTGEVWHSAKWRHDVDLKGKRVAVIGTGASAIQFVPPVAKAADSVVLVQRTPAWVIPRRDRRLTTVEKRVYRRFPRLQRAVRSSIYLGRELYVLGFAVRPSVMSVPRRIALRHLERQVPDPQLRAKLTPDYEIGCKRILISNNFYPAVASQKVELLTGGLRSVAASSVTSGEGQQRDVDVIIFGTGFHVTDLPIAQHISGREGRSLADAWAGGMHAHKGSAVPGFPNLFFGFGPNTGTGHTSQVFMIESQIDYVAQALETARRHHADVVEVRKPAEARWTDAVQERMSKTVWSTGGCASYYQDASGRITTLWPSFSFRFRHALRRFDAAAYRFEQRPASHERDDATAGEMAKVS